MILFNSKITSNESNQKQSKNSFNQNFDLIEIHSRLDAKCYHKKTILTILLSYQGGDLNP